MKQIAHCTGIWDRKYSGNPHKKWRITTRKKSLSTSFKRALFELSVVWLESLINCSNVLKPSIDSQTLTSPISFTPTIYGSRISNTISNWTEQSQDLKIIDTHFQKMSIIHLEWLFSRTEAHCNIGWDGCGWLCLKKTLHQRSIWLITRFVDWHRSNFLRNVLHYKKFACIMYNRVLSTN